MSAHVLLATTIAFAFCAATARSVHAAESIVADVVVYGGTSGGVVAAVQAARLGKSAIIIESGRHLGGMTSGGLSWTDVGNAPDRIDAIGGLAREVYRRIGAEYGVAPGKEFAPPATDDATRVGVDFAKPASLSFEPKVAEKVLNDLVAAAKVSVYYSAPLASVEKGANRITALVAGNGQRFSGRVFIDATYEGDLLAAAGVSSTLGREANAQYGETANGIQSPAKKPPAGRFVVPLDPYRTRGDAASGLLPYLLQAGDLGQVGAADRRIQSYNYRVCLTDRAANRLPIAPPADYDAANYELLARWIAARQAAGERLTLRSFLKYDPLQNGKYDFNNRWPISTDFIGGADEYPEASPAKRAEITRRHEDYLRGLFHFLATDKRSPPEVRAETSRFGLCRDEFLDTGGWPHQLYVREARRMVSDFVMTEHHCTGAAVAPHSIGLGTYGIDMHAVRRIVHAGQPVNEGSNSVSVPRPYPIAYDAIVPKQGECDNLLATFALSASHVAFGSIRMEPVFMTLSQSAATAAALAIDDDVAIQAVDYKELRDQLLADGQVLEWGQPDR
ncbi:FAD-dependent oxidoreductase [Lacipirellula parvula]|uniref:Xanthan lyase n=1 Tax=Lacipirellula parvula TaxID=2650471 RepID=A0A5K7XHJ7_9BACT|nr:FAD-dependent oxidoreductase [Lacipirellula parvula]BBO33683.1 hypothetical protein PLANPX_3295 [Lacipirellula parvula]